MFKCLWKRLELKHPFTYQSETRNFKDSGYLSLEIEDKHYLSELSIFAGLHNDKREFYEKKIEDLSSIQISYPKKPFDSLDSLSDWAQRYHHQQQLPANLCQALDVLWLQYFSERELLPIKLKELYQKKEYTIPIARLVTDLKKQISEIQNGCTYKIKVARLPFEHELELIIKAFNQAPKAKFRLDANMNWTSAQLIKLSKQLNEDHKNQLEYIEDPCSQQEWCSSYPQHELPLARESALSTNEPGLKALVYKPTTQYGFFEGLQWIERQQMGSISPILSSSFESDLGLSFLALMAKSIKSPKAQGLGTLSHLTSPHYDKLSPFVSQSEGKLRVLRSRT